MSDPDHEDVLLTRFNVYSVRDDDLLFSDVFYDIVHTTQRQGMTNAVIMSGSTWARLDVKSLVPISNVVNVIVSDDHAGIAKNNVWHVRTLEAALHAVAVLPNVDVAFVVGVDAVTEALTHFVDGIDYVYVEYSDVVDVDAILRDESHFERLSGFDSKTARVRVYANTARKQAGARSLTPWSVTRRDVIDDDLQTQYKFLMASVIRNGVYDAAKNTYTQVGLVMTVCLRDGTVPWLQTAFTPPLLTRMRTQPEAYYRTYCHLYVDDVSETLLIQDTATVHIRELNVVLHVCRVQAVLACTATFDASQRHIDSTSIAALSMFVCLLSKRMKAIAQHFTLVFPVCTIDAAEEGKYLPPSPMSTVHINIETECEPLL
jgi:hypothetical protein